jgi:hypothetical protein
MRYGLRQERILQIVIMRSCESGVASM